MTAVLKSWHEMARLIAIIYRLVNDKDIHCYLFLTTHLYTEESVLFFLKLLKEFAKACEGAGTSQAAQLTKMMKAFIEEVNSN